MLLNNNIKITTDQLNQPPALAPRRSDYKDKMNKENEKRLRAYQQAMAPIIDYELNKSRRVYANEDEKKRM